MSGPGLITSYLDALARQLPGPVVEEVADGLEETYQRHLDLGLAPDAAAAAAVAEFGAPELIAAEFARAHPARRAARRLLVTGPVVGSCWAVALITSRAWTWPVPVAAGLVPGLALVAVVALLGFAARSTRYRPVGRAGAAGCIGTAALDTFMEVTGVAGRRSGCPVGGGHGYDRQHGPARIQPALVRPVLAGNGLADGAAAFDEHDVAPAAPRWLARWRSLVPTTRSPAARCRAGLAVFSGEDAGLDGPDPGVLGGGESEHPGAGGRCPGRERWGGHRPSVRSTPA